MSKLYLIIAIVSLLTFGAIFLWNLIIRNEEKREEYRMYEAIKGIAAGNPICPDCKLYADKSKYDYCYYAGQCTTFCSKCRYFEKKGGN